MSPYHRIFCYGEVAQQAIFGMKQCLDEAVQEDFAA